MSLLKHTNQNFTLKLSSRWDDILHKSYIVISYCQLTKIEYKGTSKKSMKIELKDKFLLVPKIETHAFSPQLALFLKFLKSYHKRSFSFLKSYHKRSWDLGCCIYLISPILSEITLYKSWTKNGKRLWICVIDLQSLDQSVRFKFLYFFFKKSLIEFCYCACSAVDKAKKKIKLVCKNNNCLSAESLL